MMSRRVVVQRWPAVPTAPNKSALKARRRSAEGVMIIALFPPSSKSVRPNRFATNVATARPILVEPVAETSGTRLVLSHKVKLFRGQGRLAQRQFMRAV